MTRQDFTSEIEASPLDDSRHRIFADWLDENDCPEEAARHRQWVEAFHFIKQFTRVGEDAIYKENDDGEYERKLTARTEVDVDYKKVMDEIEWWRQCICNEYTMYDLGGSISFGTNYAADALEDEETRRRFWECFYVLTGVQAPEQLREQTRYSCAC